MGKGKKICNALKEIRRQIALINNIEFVTSECGHKGNCKGTCQKCEQEVKYLEEQLASLEQLGKVTHVVGVSFGLATLAPVMFSLNDSDDDQLEGYEPSETNDEPDQTEGDASN